MRGGATPTTRRKAFFCVVTAQTGNCRRGDVFSPQIFLRGGATPTTRRKAFFCVVAAQTGNCRRSDIFSPQIFLRVGATPTARRKAFFCVVAAQTGNCRCDGEGSVDPPTRPSRQAERSPYPPMNTQKNPACAADNNKPYSNPPYGRWVG